MNEAMQTERDETLFAQQQVVRLQALLEASRVIHSTIALSEVLTTVLQVVVRELELTGAFFTEFLCEFGHVPEGSRRVEPPPVGGLRFALHDKTGAVFTELVAIPEAGRTLTLDEVDFLESLAIQASVAIENARFHERTVQWQRLESDLASARQVQRSLLPQAMPEIPGYMLAMRQVTCYAVGGDYLDIVPMADGQTTIVVADVAGKGLASALVGTSFRSAFRAMVNAGVSVAGDCASDESSTLQRRGTVAAQVRDGDPAAAGSGNGYDTGRERGTQSSLSGDRLRGRRAARCAADRCFRDARGDAAVGDVYGGGILSAEGSAAATLH